MALVKSDKCVVPLISSLRSKKETRIKLPPICQPLLPLDYNKLRELCAIHGLGDGVKAESSAEAHQEFMSHFRHIFVQPAVKRGIPRHAESRSCRKTPDLSNQKSKTTRNTTSKTTGHLSTTASNVHGTPATPVDQLMYNEMSHEIGDYLDDLRGKKHRQQKKSSFEDSIVTLRTLLKQLPVERTAVENDQIFRLVSAFPDVTELLEPAVLRELCVVAQLDTWKEDGLTLFSHSSFHVILKGAVRPHSFPFMVGVGKKFHENHLSANIDLPLLIVGNCFGCFKEIEDIDANRVLTVETVELHNEFMVISVSDYARVIEQMKQRNEAEKMSLLQSCATFMLWSNQPLSNVASLIEWTTFPPNTVLASEGYKAPFMAVIKSGECHVLRLVETSASVPGLDSERHKKTSRQVVMGKLGSCQSFGEISVIENEPISCSIVTATEVQLACISMEKLKELDMVTLQLLSQSGVRTFANLTQLDIRNEFVRQEMKREWNEFKHKVIMDVINTRGIRPGYGKWSK